MAVVGLAQQAKLEGRWEGTTQSPQGERPTTATFKKEGSGYSGTITGMRGDMPFKEVKVDGDKVTAVAQVETGQGSVTINYSFTLQGDNLKGKGDVDFGGQNFSFDVILKRAGEGASPAAAPQAQPQQPAPQPGQQQSQDQPRPQRRDVPQPQQKQSLDYFVGQWTFKWIGRESPLGPGPRDGTITFKKTADGKSLESRAESKTDEGTLQESAVIGFDEATKMLTFNERRGSVQITSKGDWSSPISIRFTIDPIKVKGQTLQLRRTISVVAAHSFTVTEELSVDGGPFQRLGNGLYTKVLSPTANK
jgi:hypothetical protein